MMAVAEVSQESLKQRLNVSGGHGLNGSLHVSGAKNSALVLMTASLLSQETIELTNIPALTDIDGMSAILESLGVQVDRASDRIRLTASELSGSAPPMNWSTACAPVSSASDLFWDGWDMPGFPFQGMPHRGTSCRRTHPRPESPRRHRQCGAWDRHGIHSWQQKTPVRCSDRARLPQRRSHGNHPDGRCLSGRRLND